MKITTEDLGVHFLVPGMVGPPCHHQNTFHNRMNPKPESSSTYSTAITEILVLTTHTRGGNNVVLSGSRRLV